MTSINNDMYKVEVVKISGLNRTAKSIRLRFKKSAQAKTFIFEPGQYVMVSVLGYGEAPLTITTSPAELPEFEIAVRSVGVATQAMNRLKTGDICYIRGPFGNGIITREVYGKELVLIAGGIGLAPLRSAINNIKDDKTLVSSLKIIYGAKTPEELVFKGEFSKWEKFAEVLVTVDKGDSDWGGETGRVADVLPKVKIEKDAVAVVCGPPIMYESIANVLLKKGLGEEYIYFMLERRMKCGVGKCQHCTCGDKYVCTDGPTFSLAELEKMQLVESSW